MSGANDESVSGPHRTPLLNRVRSYVRERSDPEFEFLELGPPPWTPLATPLEHSSVALVATADLHVVGDAPFESLTSPLGDTSFRVLPHATERTALALDAPYVDEKYIARDPEVALPRAALDALVAEGAIAAAGPRHVSFAQGIVRPLPTLAARAGEVAQLFREDGVDIVLLLPTCSLCVQTVAVLAREFEFAGLTTVALTMLPELTERVGTPRALSVAFPFGAPAGDPGNRALQRAVVSEALALARDAKYPGRVVDSLHRWRESTPGAEPGEAGGRQGTARHGPRVRGTRDED